MNTMQTTKENIQDNPSDSALPAWWLVFTRELADLWVGGKGLSLILIYSVVLAVMVYVFSFNTELSLIPPKEAVYEMLKNAMAVSMFISLVIGADTISGERERNTSNRCSSHRLAVDRSLSENFWLLFRFGRLPMLLPSLS